MVLGKGAAGEAVLHVLKGCLALSPSPTETWGVYATLTFAQTHHCDITEAILCCWEVPNPSKAKGEN